MVSTEQEDIRSRLVPPAASTGIDCTNRSCWRFLPSAPDGARPTSASWLATRSRSGPVVGIGLPGESGYELIRKVRQRPADRGGALPAVALTAYARLQDRMQALAREGAHGSRGEYAIRIWICGRLNTFRSAFHISLPYVLCLARRMR